MNEAVLTEMLFFFILLKLTFPEYFLLLLLRYQKVPCVIVLIVLLCFTHVKVVLTHMAVLCRLCVDHTAKGSKNKVTQARSVNRGSLDM